uniref:STAS domain-containing protein n=1 Tax=Caenorhabditis tropicalis TaxID=1561998 RepID=A0A1I7TRE8_9PELO
MSLKQLFSDRPPLNAVLQEKAQKIRYSCSPSKCLNSLLSFLPIFTWLPKYDWSHSFFGDLSGGLTMAVFSVPQGIALASITGVPPVYGLYTAIFPSFLYIFFGTSKHNALGGFAVLSLMTHGAIEKVMLRTATSYNATAYVNHTLDELFDKENDTIITNTTLMHILGNETSFVEEVTMEMWTEGVTPVKQIHVATTIIFLAGVIQVTKAYEVPLIKKLKVFMGVFRLQYLTSLFSEQVMSGFVVGGGIHVFFAQIGNMLGIELPRRNGPGYLYYRIWDLIENLDNVHIPTVCISMSSFLFLVIGKEYLAPWLNSAFNYPVPFELVLVVVGITATNYAELSRRHDVKVVGNIPTEFPPPSLPRFDLIRHIGLNAAAIAITAVAIHITVAKVVEKRYKYKINHGQSVWQCVKKWERCKSESFVTIEQMNSDRSADIFDSKLKAARRRWKRDQKTENRCKLVIDCDGFPYVDYLGLSTLKSVYVDLQATGVQCYFVVQKSELKRLFRATDFYEVVDESRVFSKVGDAVKAAEQNISSPQTKKETLTALASIITTDTMLIDEEEEQEENNGGRTRGESENSEEVMSETSVSIGEARSSASSRSSINSEE